MDVLNEYMTKVVHGSCTPPPPVWRIFVLLFAALLTIITLRKLHNEKYSELRLVRVLSYIMLVIICGLLVSEFKIQFDYVPVPNCLKFLLLV